MKLGNESGILLIVSAFLITVLAGASVMMLSRGVNEAQAVEREIDRMHAYCGAEAAFQGSLAQMGANGYTGFINTSPYSTTMSIDGTDVVTCSATTTPETADYVVVTATGTGRFSSRTIEARVFFESNLGKYLVYADTATFSIVEDAQYGEPMTDPDTGLIVYDDNGRERVEQEQIDRALMYFTGDVDITGKNINIYGDVYIEQGISIPAGKEIDLHGDGYLGGIAEDKGKVTVDDTWDDGLDKHTFEAEMFDRLQSIDLSFYQANNDVPSFSSGVPQTRYLEFTTSGDGSRTVVNEYNDQAYSVQINSYTLPEDSSIVYVEGDAYVKGTVKGRVSVVSSDDIWIQDSLVYANGTMEADESDSAAYIAQDKVYFAGNDMDTCGIFYGENASGSTEVFDANYDTTGASNPTAKNRLRVHGNRIMKGASNLGTYPDRAYLYDKNLRKYRPPGLPITSVISFVREI